MMMLLMTIQENPETEAHKLEGLIARVAQDDRDGLADLYRAVSGPVYGLALSILKNAHEAEDVLHDCFLRIHGAAASYKPQGRPMAWIQTITRNLCMEALRRHSKAGDPLDETWEERLEAPGMDQADRLMLRACMEDLDDQTRQILALHALSGFKHREIAQMMDMSLPAVLSRYNRAVKKLRTVLQEG